MTKLAEPASNCKLELLRIIGRYQAKALNRDENDKFINLDPISWIIINLCLFILYGNWPDWPLLFCL